MCPFISCLPISYPTPSPPLSLPTHLQLVGGQFDLEMNFIIQECESIVCMVELLDQCEPTCQAEVWSIFTAILKKSIRNLQACTDMALIQLVLQRVASTDSMIAGKEDLPFLNGNQRFLTKLASLMHCDQLVL